VVHVWRFDIEPDRNCGWSELSADEFERGERYRFPRHRLSFFARRAALRRILGHYVRRPPAELVFEYNPWGKPRLAASAGRQHLEFSATSSNGVALIAVTTGRSVGIDLEFDDPRLDCLSLADQFFAAREKTALRQLSGPALRSAFYRLWTANEALGKAIGCGLMQSSDRPDIDLSSLLCETTACCGLRDPASSTSWRLQRLSLGLPGFHAAVCIEGSRGVEIAWQAFDTTRC
jgi:4'-phosphopantetheinyl transferase